MEDSPDIPANVAQFERLMYIASVLGFFLALGGDGLALPVALGGPIKWGFIVGIQTHEPLHPGGFATFLLAVLSLGISIWIIQAIVLERNNWLRWLTFVLYVLGAFFVAINSGLEFPLHLIRNAMELGLRALVGWAYFFVFTGDAVYWFGKSANSAIVGSK